MTWRGWRCTFHADCAKFEPPTSGAEWWTLAMDGATPDVARHWDRDYTLDGSGISPSPHVATVICLSDRAPAGAAQRVCLAALGSTALWHCLAAPRSDDTGCLENS